MFNKAFVPKKPKPLTALSRRREPRNFADFLKLATSFDLEMKGRAGSPLTLRDAAAIPAVSALKDIETSRRGMSARDVVKELRRRRLAIGHNAARFDIPELESLAGTTLSDIPLVDTLWLSPLAFPANDTHRLEKPYLEKDKVLPDPEEDARNSVLLLRDEVERLRAMDRDWLEILCWLCCLGPASLGYEFLFEVIFESIEPLPSAPLEAARVVVPKIRAIFGDTLCLHGLHDQVLMAFKSGNGWPLAWALSWHRHKVERAAPARWLLETFPEFQLALDDLGRRRCSHRSCIRCRDHGTPLESMAHWFPPAPGQILAFQPPFDLGYLTYQEQVMRAALARRDTLGILPTGTGKSRCFQVPALEQHARTGDLAVVISPLKALMEDQIKKAKSENLPGVDRLHGDLDAVECERVFDAVRSGHTALLYISPEGLGGAAMRKLLESRRIGMWVFDEVHCVPTWGKGFRGDYWRAVSWARDCGAKGSDRATILCLTATARPETRKDIQTVFSQRLGRRLQVIDGGADRPNLTYRVLEREGELDDQIDRLLRDPQLLPGNGQAIIYAYRQKDTLEIAAQLMRRGHRAAAYHAELHKERKARVEEAFADGDLKVVVATIAFGMGVDTPRVRLVVHAAPPASLEAYAQEAGRAGRDRRAATCIMLRDPEEMDRRHASLARGHLAKEDMDTILAHLLGLRRRLRDARDNSALRPTLSLPYRLVARDVLGLPKGKDPGKSLKFQSDRINRIVDELETNGLIEKLRHEQSLSHLRVQMEALSSLIAQRSALPKIEGMIVDVLARELEKCPGEIPALPEDKEALADACNPKRPPALSHLSQALNRLKEKGLLHAVVELEVGLGPRGTAEKIVETWALKGEAVLDAVTDLFEEREAAAAEQEEGSEEKGAADAALLEKPLETTLMIVSRRAEGKLPEEVKLFPKEALQLLEELSELGLLEMEDRPSGMTRALSLKLPHDLDDASDLPLRSNRQIARVLAALRHLAGDQRFLEVELETLLDTLVSLDMDLEQTWRRPDGSHLTLAEAKKLCRRHLRKLSELKVITVSRGLYPPREECTVRVAERSTNITVRSYTKDMFTAGVEAFQQEEIRQLHLVDGFGSQVLEDESQAPALLRRYFKDASEESLEAVYEGAELELVRNNRPAPVGRQIKLRSRLDERQAAIVHGSTELQDTLILAGPGAGKTRVLVERIVWLVSVERVPPDQILALCYSRRAAEEIRERLREDTALGRLGALVAVYTYHSFALQVLGKSFAELSDEAMPEQAIARKGEDLNEGPPTAFDLILKSASERLREHRRANGDMSDILLRRFRWAFVDEFQDVTDTSFDLIREISQQSQKSSARQTRVKPVFTVKGGEQVPEPVVDVRFCAVGDDDQNIYDFDGASGKHIRDFEKLFPGAARPELTWNYRSSGAILAAAAEIISGCSDRLKLNPIEINPARCGDPLQGAYFQSQRPDLGKVALCWAEDGSIELQAAIAAARLLGLSGQVPKAQWKWPSTAVLVRNRKHIAVVEGALEAAGIEVSRDLQGLVPMARVREALHVRGWLEEMGRLGRLICKEDADQAAARLDERFDNRWSAPIAEWLRDLSWDEGESGGLPARQLLDEFMEWAHGWRPRQSGVAVLTAHSSKGLEFDNVVVLEAGWAKGYTLNVKDADRRLFYVAATRARHSLSLVSSGLGIFRKMLDGRSADHLTKLNVAPHPEAVRAAITPRLMPCSVRDVFLSFPAWDGFRCTSTEESREGVRRTISNLRVGDRLILERTLQADSNPWHLFAERKGRRVRIGKMQKGFEPGADGQRFSAMVFALVGWNKTDSEEGYQGSIKLDRWLTVVPAWSSKE
ncbi:RecQ family ATP-dependent DNA helicase [Salipiger sp. CCB-MM3]|uniref:RecQ family ATP-dependent DNA helicase n=1 Tax=Salipiger sp. CCB-MM3 TaxID=1792508 RepID=UPI000AA2A934|nr:RecQ family ATP-dependent DNA helicase [Salipiger sp. CCB-MM3]